MDFSLSALWLIHILNKTEGFEKQSNFQVVVILMGNFNKDYTGLGQETLRRLNFALSLNDDIHIENFLCVGGARPANSVFGAELMKDYLQINGIPAGRIYADGRSFDTKGNWHDALKLIENKNWSTVGVISSALHLYRTKQAIIEPRKEVKVSLVPFQYKSSVPKTTIFDLWKSVHYEWITYILYALPESFYRAVLLLIRPQ